MTPTEAVRPTTNDLWASAAAEMSDDDRKNINFSCPDKLKILSDLLELTTQSKQECTKKRWQYTRNSGEKVILVDLFGKIVKWIDIFKQVGDTAVQYDPVHAALPWAGIRFLLQIAVNDIDKFAFAIEDIVLIAEIVCRYSIFEEIFLQSPSPAAGELQRALVKFYAAIMIYLSKTKAYFEENAAKRIIKSGLLQKSDLKVYFGAIATAQETVDRCSSIVGMQEHIDQHKDLRRLLECIDGPIERMSVDLKSIKDGLELSKRTEILHWISPEPYMQHHEQAKREVLEGTGKWLISDPIFNRWKKESVSSILWLHGIQGSGKSKLVSIVIEDAKKSFYSGHSPAPVFFYCARNTAEPARSDPNEIIASIARQLSSLQPAQPLLPPIVSAYKKREMEGFASGSLKIDESRALIIQLAEYYPLTTIVIDALDECDPERRVDLLETLELLLQESSSLVKIFVSSRDDQNIVLHLRDYPNLKLSSKRNKDDISSFVTAETNRLIRRRELLAFSSNKEKLKTKIIKQVTEKADGMFRWASLQLQSLCNVTTDEGIHERLGRLPPKLEDLYLELYERLTRSKAEADREVTINTFSWLLCAQTTLSSKEFLAALSTFPYRQFEKLTKEHVLAMCSNMVVFDQTADTFRFAHLSVREFLEKLPEYSREATNTRAAETCLLNVLSASDYPETRRFLSDYIQDSSYTILSHSLREYSTIYWAPHCQLAGNQRTISSTLQKLLFHFLSNESDSRSAVAVWTDQVIKQFYDRSVKWRLRQKLRDIKAEKGTAVFIVSCFNLHEAVTIRANFPDNITNSNGRTPLWVAATYGSCDVISILLRDKLTTISEEVVKAAAGNEESGKEMMMLLLNQRGTEVVITEDVVKEAAGNWGGKEVMMLLLDKRGPEVMITEEVVIAAAGNSKSGKEVMILLLDQRRTEVVITEEVVKAAAGNEESGKEVMMLLLDQRGIDVMITEQVVKAAAGNYKSGKEVMKLLLDQRGTDIIITEEVVKTIVGKFGEEVIMLFLDQRGTEFVITEDVVKAAAGNCWSGKEVMMLLLDQRGLEVVITEDVVKAAARNIWVGKEVMMLLLDKRGTEVIITEDVVKAAAGNFRSGKEVMILLLDQRGLEVVITEEVTMAAATSGQESVLKLIEECRHILLPKEKWLIAQLYNAARSGDHKTVQNLLAQGVEPDLKNIRGVSPLWIAASRGYSTVVQILLSTKLVDFNSKSIAGRPPIFWAAAKGYKDVVWLLLEAGADPNLIDEDGQTPLLMAKKYGHGNIARMLGSD